MVSRCGSVFFSRTSAGVPEASSSVLWRRPAVNGRTVRPTEETDSPNHIMLTGSGK